MAVMRGKYEADEERPSLASRGCAVETWTMMETLIFNAVTTQWDRTPGAPLFSRRLQVAQVMLDAFDKETRVQP